MRTQRCGRITAFTTTCYPRSLALTCYPRGALPTSTPRGIKALTSPLRSGARHRKGGRYRKGEWHSMRPHEYSRGGWCRRSSTRPLWQRRGHCQFRFVVGWRSRLHSGGDGAANAQLRPCSTTQRGAGAAREVGDSCTAAARSDACGAAETTSGAQGGGREGAAGGKRQQGGRLDGCAGE